MPLCPVKIHPRRAVVEPPQPAAANLMMQPHRVAKRRHSLFDTPRALYTQIQQMRSLFDVPLLT